MYKCGIICVKMRVVSAGRSYGGVPASARRLARRERLVEATFELLATDGPRGLTVRKVAAAAGVSPRYVYEDFSDLDDLRVQAFDSAAEEVGGRLLDAVATAAPDAASQLEALAEVIVAFASDQPHKARLLLADSRSDPTLADRRLLLSDLMARGFTYYLRAYLADRSPPARAVDLTAHAMVGVTAETMTAWLGGSLPYPRKRLVADLAAIFEAMVGALSQMR
jgi:AcrR family transcriptional regulator